MVIPTERKSLPYFVLARTRLPSTSRSHELQTFARCSARILHTDSRNPRERKGFRKYSRPHMCDPDRFLASITPEAVRKSTGI